MPEPIFYSYAYPTPDGFADAKVSPEAASWNGDLGEFVVDVEGRLRSGRREGLDTVAATLALDSYYLTGNIKFPASPFRLTLGGGDDGRLQAAALEDGGLDASRRIFCPGYVRMYDRRYRCHFGGGHGWVNLHQALVKSCNVYFYTLGRELGIEEIHRYGDRNALDELNEIGIARIVRI